MATPPRSFVPDGFYHIFNRGVEKRKIFLDQTDFQRFLEGMAFYQQAEQADRFSRTSFELADRAEPLLYDLIAFVFMPNHYHVVLRARTEGGVSTAIANLQNSYTKYFNTRYERVGALFQGPFQSVPITSDEQLVHVVRYALLNPFVSGLVENLDAYSWSAYGEYFNGKLPRLCSQEFFLDYFASVTKAEEFVLDHADYARSLGRIKDLALDAWA